MFGYVRPYVPALRVWEHTYYQALYCGLCRSMKHNTGWLSPLALRYDLVFLVLVQLALQQRTVTLCRKRCAVHPVKRRIMAKEDVALQYAAYVSALLTYYQLQDELADQTGAKRAAARVLSGAAKPMYRRASALQELNEQMRAHLQHLTELEAKREPSLDAVADVFGQLLRDAFSAGLESTAMRRIAGEIGYHVGKWIYMVDAVDDFFSDLRQGNYNPLVLQSGGDETYLAQQTPLLTRALTMECERACQAMDLTGLPEHDGESGMVYHMLYVGMPHAAQEVLSHPGERRRARRLQETAQVQMQSASQEARSTTSFDQDDHQADQIDQNNSADTK